ncbi:MAG: class I SAM-dependent methyltransferase [Defluviitaleaceae bacterium]|nr:class I SAM-dependent methyltransferase [Defluviitaleaceae bacterium]
MSKNLPKAFIFGAGAMGQWLLPSAQKKYQVISFLDNDKTKQGTQIMGIPVYSPESIVESSYDIILIASRAGINTITEQLLGLGVQQDKINIGYVEFAVKSRIVFLNNLGELFREKGIQGCVAECGVFMGEFAKEINRTFPTDRLYLFDTFSGFDERDLIIEKNLGLADQNNQYANFSAGHFSITHEDIVIKNLPHPEMCIIRKGYFPETIQGLDETFSFVNLDFDLYQPTLSGLEYFYPRMVNGGVILIHDYFAEACTGVKAAVKEFENKVGNLHTFPIGDGLSIGINC